MSKHHVCRTAKSRLPTATEERSRTKTLGARPISVLSGMANPLLLPPLGKSTPVLEPKYPKALFWELSTSEQATASALRCLMFQRQVLNASWERILESVVIGPGFLFLSSKSERIFLNLFF